MPNVSKINGFRPVKHSTGAPYNGQANIYATATGDATPLFVGDPVALAGDADAKGIATVTRGAAGAAIVGVVVGIVPTKMDPVGGTMTTGSISLDTPQFRAASSATYVLVADSPDIVYEVEQTAAGASYTYLTADTGLNAEANYATGSTSTGASACSLNMSTKATTSTLQFKLLGAVNRVDNETIGGTSTAVKVWVQINNATLGNGTGATGQ
jgi:hypothetical protein